MNHRDFLPLFVELTKKHPDLIFWKHFERGLSGQGDIDTIAPASEVNKISSEFIGLVFNHIPDVKGVFECRYSSNVRPHFFIFESEYPNLFQFDISWQPTRLSFPWCDPCFLSEFSIINNYGVRVLRPGALSVVLVMLYGISVKGADCMKPHDQYEVKYGVLADARGAYEFVDSAIPHSLRDSLYKLISILKDGAWSSSSVRRIWLNIAYESIKLNLCKGPKHCWQTSTNLYKSLLLGQQKKHHHVRTGYQMTWQKYLDEMSDDFHVISYVPYLNEQIGS